MAQLRVPVVATVVVTLVVSGCTLEASNGGAAGGDRPPNLPPLSKNASLATWELLDPEHVGPVDQGLMVGVTRVGCAGGVTGEVLEPQVAYEQDRIVIRTDVDSIGDGGHDCPGNDTVPVEVQLDQSIGGRELVDAACLEKEGLGTSSCTTPVRWTSPARGSSPQVPDWTAPTDYTFTVQSTCGERSFLGRFGVTVEGGEVSRVEPGADSWADITLGQAPTITAILEDARATAAGGGTVEVAVDDAGVPRWVFLDPEPNAIDDEACYAISDYSSV